MTGSLLEAVLLGVASNNPSVFNQAKSTPLNEKNGKPKQFHEWNLASLIDVAFETDWIDLDVKKPVILFAISEITFTPLNKKSLAFSLLKKR